MVQWRVRGRLARSSAWLLGISASVVTLYLGYRRYAQVASPDAKVGLFLLALFAAFFLVYAITQEYRLSRKARYAEALPSIGRAHLLAMGQEHDTDREIQLVAQDVCDRLSQTLSMVTGTRCSVCVKVIESEAPTTGQLKELEVSTLCRDDQSYERPLQAVGVDHPLVGNTDFLQIFKNPDHPGLNTYLENHLPRRLDYENSSFHVYGEPYDWGPRWWQRLIRYTVSWPLPYKSTVVTPIYPLEPDDEDRLLGYLCVDSRSRGVFDSRYDVPVLRSVAAALHPLLLRWTDLVWEEEVRNGGPDGEGP